jgi:undecaprenyl-diphosphatase
LILTSFLLWQAARKTTLHPQALYRPTKTALLTLADQKTQDVLWIGCMQGLALIPGLSRSGSTIAVAHLIGWNLEMATCFSFVISIPAILGGHLLQMIRLMGDEAVFPLPLPLYLLAGSTSFLIGCVTVRFISHVYQKSKLSFFALYCLLFSVVTTYLNISLIP